MEGKTMDGKPIELKITPEPWTAYYFPAAGEKNPAKWVIEGDHERGGIAIGEVYVGGAEANGYSSEDNAKLMRAAPQLFQALSLFQAFFDNMRKGQLGRISCDIGILNDAFIETRKVMDSLKK